MPSYKREDSVVFEDCSADVTQVSGVARKFLSGLLMHKSKHSFRAIDKKPHLQKIVKGPFIDDINWLLADIAQAHLRDMAHPDATAGIYFTVWVDNDTTEQRLARIPLP